VDGILSTHRTLDKQKEWDDRQRALVEEVTSQLTGSKEYQERLHAVEREVTQSKEDAYNMGMMRPQPSGTMTLMKKT
jgi:hypothetical protein